MKRKYTKPTIEVYTTDITSTILMTSPVMNISDRSINSSNFGSFNQCLKGDYDDYEED